MRLLIIEDEKDLSDSICSYFRQEKYFCEVAADFHSAIAKVDSSDYDCILLDIGLPGGNGLDILKRLKDAGKLESVLIISAKNSVYDKITGLNLGADDYLAKPFHLSELSARISAVIRRKKFDGNVILRFNEISIDTQSKITLVNDKPLDLTRKEYELLLYFISNKGRVISKTAIVDHLWGEDIGGGNYDFIYTHIKNLRKKLLETGNIDYLRSIYGMGYKFSDK